MTKLIFVYNANSGAINTLLDVGHKLISPKTYKCKLCSLTYDTFTENKMWKRFRREFGNLMEFYHIDEFQNAFPYQKYDYPVILMQNNNTFDIFMNKEQLNVIENTEKLIKTISSKLKVTL